MKKINYAHFIDALVRITSHHDREILERSLFETLTEYQGAKEYWLYQVVTLTPELSLRLLAHSDQSNIEVSGQVMREKLPDEISQLVIQAIEVARVVSSPTSPQHADLLVIYPALDEKGAVSAVLIERTQAKNPEGQHLVHGFLRVYTNYLRLLEQSKRDKLTGLLNRETLEDKISQIIILNNEQIPPDREQGPEIANNAPQPKEAIKYWLGVLDIDYFKRINDTYGHLYGDEILILVARLMESSLRGHDLIFRYGGEEFIILIKARDIGEARQAFERIRGVVRNHQYAKVEQVTVSIGVIEISTQTGPAEVIAEADAALYYAKHNGRDQVQFYGELLSQGLIEPLEKDVEAGGVSFF
jgi:two-component system, cell cycle response regulator